MDINKELKKHYTSSQIALIEFVSMHWMNATGQDHREDVYKELIQLAEYSTPRKERD